MSVARKVREWFFPRWPNGRRRRERQHLWLGLSLGLVAAALFAVAIYFLQDRFLH
jgi:hypothetical protein